ncbi:unnamed protein product, partial [Arabidopsis lyrata]
FPQFSELTKNLRYKLAERAAGGILFELIAQSFNDQAISENCKPACFRLWQAKNFLVSVTDLTENELNNVPGIKALKDVMYDKNYH